MSKALTDSELNLIASLLRQASDEFSSHTCNDRKVPNTEGNKELLIQMVKATYDKRESEEEIQEIQSCKKKFIFTYDWMLMDYLADRCEEAAK